MFVSHRASMQIIIKHCVEIMCWFPLLPIDEKVVGAFYHGGTNNNVSFLQLLY